MGLEKIHSIVKDGGYILKIKLSDWTGDVASVHLPFQLAGEEAKYSLHIPKDGSFSPLESSLGTDAVSGLPFSTHDRDNDQKNDTNCAKHLSGKTLPASAMMQASIILFPRFAQASKTEPNPASSSLFPGGWWFSDCGRSNLNGRYFQSPPPKQRHQRKQGIFWKTWRGRYYPLKYSTMMVGPAAVHRHS